MAAATSHELEGTVAQVLSEVLNISVSSTALAKQIVNAARTGTIDSFSKVCASFGSLTLFTQPSSPAHLGIRPTTAPSADLPCVVSPRRARVSAHHC